MCKRDWQAIFNPSLIGNNLPLSPLDVADQNQGGLLNVNNTKTVTFTHPITFTATPKYVSGLYNGGSYYVTGAVGYAGRTELNFNAAFTKSSGAWVIAVGV